MTQGGQVAGGAQRALLGHHGGDAGVQHLHKGLHQLRPDAADAHAEGVGPQQHHAADLLDLIGIAGAHSVAEDQVGGEPGAHLFRNSHRGEIAEAGGDAVGHPVLVGDLLRQGPGPGQGLPGRLGESHLGAEAGHRDKLFQGQTFAVEQHRLIGVKMVHGKKRSFAVR